MVTEVQEIHLPKVTPSQVIEHFADFAAAARFDETIERVVAQSGDATRRHVRYVPKLPGWNLPEPLADVIVDIDVARHRLDVRPARGWRSLAARMVSRYHATVEVTPVADGAIARREVTYDFSPLVRRVLERRVRPALRRSLLREMHQLRDHLTREADEAKPTKPTCRTSGADGIRDASGAATTGVAIVGAGLSGIACASKLRAAGINDFVVIEKSAGVGGTWQENNYPGCAVDIPSSAYSYSFRPNPYWTRNYASQAELLTYIEGTVDDLALGARLRLDTTLLGAQWRPDRCDWLLETDQGDLTARHVVFATGLLHEPTLADVPGLDSFPGPAFHTAKWDHDIDLAGKRVAVIGTGCSAIQVIPALQTIAREVLVFQRSAAWVVPRMDFPIPAPLQAMFARFPWTQELTRAANEGFLKAVGAVVQREPLARAITPAAKLMLWAQVRDRHLRRQLTPRFTFGCKRLLVSNTYLPAMTRPNVSLIDSGLASIEHDELIAADGRRVRVDAIVFGSGFEMRHPPVARLIKDSNAATLAERWTAHSPAAYRGTTVPGMPNAYFLLGPNVVLYYSLLAVAEWQADYVVDAIRVTDELGISAVEVQQEAFETFNTRLEQQVSGSVYNRGGCTSVYLDEHGKNFVNWPWSPSRMRDELRVFDLENYDTD